MSRRTLIAGNWKMNGLRATLGELAAIAAAARDAAAEVAICPPFTLVDAVARAADGAFAVGGQDCHHAEQGAHTGCVSAAMLADLGAAYVIVGHSERRQDQGERDADVRAKAEAATAAGLVPIVCVGETEAQRDAGETLLVVAGQLDGSVPPAATGEGLVVAYEPIWAIGTGRTPTAAQVAEVHGFLRAKLIDLLGEEGVNVRLLYGGSVKPANAAELLAIADVDGALVGGASLTAADFVPIIRAA